jgi:hypothetical protein
MGDEIASEIAGGMSDFDLGRVDIEPIDLLLQYAIHYRKPERATLHLCGDPTMLVEEHV